MNLVWVFDSEVILGNHVGELTSERKIILMNYYTQSIINAKKYGYHTIIYCDDYSTKYFEGNVDEIIVVDCSNRHLLYDSLKMYVLEHRKDDDYCIMDGDVLLHNQLPMFTGDVIFDAYEISNYNHSYKHILDKLTELNVQEVIPFWKVQKFPIICVGLLSIRNEELKNHFIKYYNLFYNFVSDNKDKLQLDYTTAIGSQYLLTLCSEGYIHQPLSNIVGYENPYYLHHCGPLKYNNPMLPKTHLIHPQNKKTLL